MERLWADLCGPINVSNDDHGVLSACNNVKYISVIIDEFSRKIFIECLQIKGDAYSHVTNLIPRLETQTNKKCCEFVSDNGGEYRSHQLNDWFKLKGIRQSYTPTYTPQRNGICERANLTLMNYIRSMLIHSGLDKSFWVCAAYVAEVLSGFRPHPLNKHVTVDEKFYSIKPTMSRLRVFGSDAYLHTNLVNQSKLDPRASKSIFVGYSRDVEAAYKAF